MKKGQDKVERQLVNELAGLHPRAAGREATEVKCEETKEGSRQPYHTISGQPQAALDVAIPITPIGDSILLVQLNGKQDGYGIPQLMELLPERITKMNSLLVVVDLTDVPYIDTEIAQHLTDIIAEVRLLSAQVVLTGIHPHKSNSLVNLGIDLSDIKTCHSLINGLWVAMEMLEPFSI